MRQVHFSKATRAQHIEEMEREGVDLVVIGGGITGAGIAWDAAMRGLRVALLEQHDFASGTSSRSTKLIHGGLRYLAQGEVGLVREVGRERAILHRLAGHVVHPMLLLLPIYRNGQYGRLGTSVGLWLYDRLANVQAAERRLMLSKKRVTEREPDLRQEGLQGGGLYVEYRTDDARLTLEVAKSAHFAGAMLANYAKVEQLLYGENGQVTGVLVQDRLENRSFAVRARRVVNAAGPWVDAVRSLDGPLAGKRLHLTKGVHITVDASVLPIAQALYLGTDDGRMIFLIPRQGKTYIGTTDTDYAGPLEKPVCTREEVEYLLRAVNAHFPGAHLTLVQVESAWAGLRPLLHEEGKGPSELSRKEEIFVSRSGLYTIAGGKLTGFRKMAEKIVDRVVADLQGEDPHLQLAACATGRTPLAGGDLGGQGFAPFYEAMREIGRTQYGLSHQVLHSLLGRYGSNVRVILSYLEQDPDLREQVGAPLPILRAELRYAVEQEMTVSLTDFLLRRTGDLLFAAEQAIEAAPQLLRELAAMLDWDTDEQERQWGLWQEAVQEARGFLQAAKV